MNFGVMLPGMISGWICKQTGYELFFIIALVVSIPAFILAWIVPFTHSDKDAENGESELKEALTSAVEGEEDSQF